MLEMLCVIAIMSLLASISWPSIVGAVMGNQLTNTAYELGGVIQQARATAVTKHTYVWLGFYSYSQNGDPSLRVASVVGNSGQATDLQTGNYQFADKPAVLRNVSLATQSNYSALPGLDVTDNTDAGSQSFSFQMSVPGASNAQFSEVIVFGPDGQAYLPTSSGGLQSTPIQCVGVGLKAGNSATSLHTVAVQVHGLSGQVSVFQQ